MKVAYLSPLPPVPSGVSEYSTDLLPHLAEQVDLRVFAALPAAGEAGGLPIEQPEEFDRAAAAGEFDLAVYHMGNNLHHRFVHRRAARVPGLLVLHDLVLHHFYVEELLARGAEEEYLALMEEVYGEPGRGAGLANVHEVTSPTTLFAFPLCERLAAVSRGVLVHNRRAARYLRAQVDGVPIEVVPMGIPAPGRDPLPEPASARRDLGLDPSALVVGVFGFLTPVKRAEVVVRAFARVAPGLPGALLVLVGEASPACNLAGLARALGIAERVRLTGYLPYAEVKQWVAAADVFVNLRHPTAGETSASLLRLLGWGKAVIVSDYAQFRELPENVALRVPVGGSELDELAELLALLACRPDLGRRQGEHAARFVAEQHGLSAAARGYADFARRVAAAGQHGQGGPGRLRSRLGPPMSRVPRHPRARLDGEELPEVIAAGSRLSLRLRLENTGDTTWLSAPQPGGGEVEVGGYLRGTALACWPLEPAAALPCDVVPGATSGITWSFTVPRLPGAAELVIGPRIPGWGWLHARGSQALIYRLRIAG